MAPRTDTPDLTDEELVQRMEALRRTLEEGTVPLWTGEEPLSAYLDRARSQ